MVKRGGTVEGVRGGQCEVRRGLGRDRPVIVDVRAHYCPWAYLEKTGRTECPVAGAAPLRERAIGWRPALTERPGVPGSVPSGSIAGLRLDAGFRGPGRLPATSFGLVSRGT